jgi:hypothetical protein
VSYADVPIGIVYRRPLQGRPALFVVPQGKTAVAERRNERLTRH